jgi:hypothetical protein
MEGAVGDLLISDGYDAGLGDADGSSNEPTTLTQLLAQLATLPPNDAVAGTLTLDNGVKAKTTVTLKKTNATVSEYAKDISLQVKF